MYVYVVRATYFFHKRLLLPAGWYPWAVYKCNKNLGCDVSYYSNFHYSV